MTVSKKECALTAATLHTVRGLINDAGHQAKTYAQTHHLFNLATLLEPYRIEGKKTMALEIVTQLGWKLPDAVIYPTGGGTGLIAMHKGFQELVELGWVSGKLPQLFSIQTSGCQPIVQAYQAGLDSA